MGLRMDSVLHEIKEDEKGNPQMGRSEKEKETFMYGGQMRTAGKNATDTRENDLLEEIDAIARKAMKKRQHSNRGRITVKKKLRKPAF